MGKKNNIINRINNCYVREGYAQVMVSYYGNITILNKNLVLYHDNGYELINSYLNDERRNQFPYSNIPIHISKESGLKYKNINQIYNFNEPYISVRNDCIFESRLVVDKEEVLLSKTILFNGFNFEKNGEKQNIELSYDKLREMFEPMNNDKKKRYVMNLNGNIYSQEENLIPDTKEKIVELIKKNIYDSHINMGCLGSYYFFDGFPEYKEEIFNKIINSKNPDEKILNDIEIKKFIDDNILLFDVEEDNIEIKLVSVRFIEENNYQIKIINIPVIDYNLEHLKNLDCKIVDTKNPKVKKNLNPDIPKEDIVESKFKIKQRKK